MIPPKETPALWRARNPEGYAVGDLIAFLASDAAQMKAAALRKENEEVVIARDGASRVVWDGLGFRLIGNDTVSYLSYYEVLELFCGPTSAAPPSMRSLECLAPFLKAARPTACPVPPSE